MEAAEDRIGSPPMLPLHSDELVEEGSLLGRERGTGSGSRFRRARRREEVSKPTPPDDRVRQDPVDEAKPAVISAGVRRSTAQFVHDRFAPADDEVEVVALAVEEVDVAEGVAVDEEEVGDSAGGDDAELT